MEKSKQRTGKIVIIVAMVALLVALACMAGVTFSKYVTNNQSNTLQATVAKWGYVVTINADDLFASDYTKASGSTNATKASSGAGVAVKAAGVVVAPGTEGSLTFSVKGTAEVASKISISVNSGYQDIVLKYSDSTPEYHPIKWTLKKGAQAVTGAENVTLAELVTAIGNITDLYHNANTTVDETYTLSWSWAFSNGNDAADTILANLVYNAGEPETPATIPATVDQGESVTALSFVLTVGIEQVQEIPQA